MSRRVTDYAEELNSVSIKVGDSSVGEARLERLRIISSEKEEIRFSWWKDGHFMPRALDLPEGDLLSLMKEAIEKGVLTDDFVVPLRAYLNESTNC